MTILLDESVPRLIKTQLSEFPITTVQEMGWSGMKNGELLAEAEQQFTILITADQKLRYQQKSYRHATLNHCPAHQSSVLGGNIALMCPRRHPQNSTRDTH